jgi:hypothetical protein
MSDNREMTSLDRHSEPERDYLAEAADIIAGKPSAPRTILRVPEREHLIALTDFYQRGILKSELKHRDKVNL